MTVKTQVIKQSCSTPAAAQMLTFQCWGRNYYQEVKRSWEKAAPILSHARFCSTQSDLRCCGHFFFILVMIQENKWTDTLITEGYEQPIISGWCYLWHIKTSYRDKWVPIPLNSLRIFLNLLVPTGIVRIFNRMTCNPAQTWITEALNRQDKPDSRWCWQTSEIESGLR